MPTIARFSLRLTKPSGTRLAPPAPGAGRAHRELSDTRETTQIGASG